MDRFFSCQICMEPFDNAEHYPSTLLCGHTFCLACVTKMAEKKQKVARVDVNAGNPQTSVRQVGRSTYQISLAKQIVKVVEMVVVLQCPVCRDTTIFKPHEEPRKNFLVADLVSAVAEINQSLEAKKEECETPEVCKPCEEQAEQALTDILANTFPVPPLPPLNASIDSRSPGEGEAVEPPGYTQFPSFTPTSDSTSLTTNIDSGIPSIPTSNANLSEVTPNEVIQNSSNTEGNAQLARVRRNPGFRSTSRNADETQGEVHLLDPRYYSSEFSRHVQEVALSQNLDPTFHDEQARLRRVAPRATHEASLVFDPRNLGNDNGPTSYDDFHVVLGNRPDGRVYCQITAQDSVTHPKFVSCCTKNVFIF